jgi:AcrR family transcriptional regulator
MSTHSDAADTIMRDGLKTKARIEREALTLFADKGIHATTVRDIAGRSGVAEGSLYRYYPSKDALARELFTRNAALIQSEFATLHQEAEDLEAFLSACIIYICGLYDRDPVLFRYVFLAEPSTLAALGVTHALPQDFLTTIIAAAFLRRGQTERDAVLVTAQIMGTLLQAAACHLYGKLHKPLTDYADELFLAVFKILQG